MTTTDPMPTINAILDPATRYPDVKFDSDGAALGINWETTVADMELGL